MAIKENNDVTATSANVASEKKGMSDTRRIVILVIGDLLVFLIFSIVGRRNHDEAAGMSAFAQIVWTAAPFAVAWFLVSPFVGAFKRGIEVKPAKMAQRTALAWLCSWPVALLLRGLIERQLPGGTFGRFVAFALVTLVVNMALLLVWRWPFALIAGRKRG